MTSGLQESELIIIAARPSMGRRPGRSTLRRCGGSRGKAVAVFSLEMSKASLLANAGVAGAGEFKGDSDRSDSMRDDRAKLIKGLELLMESKIFIDDTPGITLAEMRAKARRLKQQQGQLDLIVIDYLQLMTGSSSNSKGL